MPPKLRAQVHSFESLARSGAGRKRASRASDCASFVTRKQTKQSNSGPVQHQFACLCAICLLHRLSCCCECKTSAKGCAKEPGERTESKTREPNYTSSEHGLIALRGRCGIPRLKGVCRQRCAKVVGWPPGLPGAASGSRRGGISARSPRPPLELTSPAPALKREMLELSSLTFIFRPKKNEEARLRLETHGLRRLVDFIDLQ